MFYNQEEINGILDSITCKVTEDGKHQYEYVGFEQVSEDEYSNASLFDCAMKNMYSFSFVKTIYSFIFQNHKKVQKSPCTVVFDFLDKDALTASH